MQLPKMPEKISDETFRILTREENAAIVERLEQVHGLDEDETPKFSAILAHVFMGTVPLEKLEETLEENLDLFPEDAKNLTRDVILEMFYPHWRRFPNIDEVLVGVGGKIPEQKPMPPMLGGGGEEAATVSYPKAPQTQEAKTPELFGGEEDAVPRPPSPRAASNQRPRADNGVERDVPWIPQKNVARPDDVAKLLEENLLRKPDETK